MSTPAQPDERHHGASGSYVSHMTEPRTVASELRRLAALEAEVVELQEALRDTLDEISDPTIRNRVLRVLGGSVGGSDQ